MHIGSGLGGNVCGQRHWSPTIFHIASTALSAWVDFQSDNVRYRSRVFYNDESVPGVPEQETGKEKTRPGQVRPHCRRVHAQQKASGGKGAGTGGDRSCATGADGGQRILRQHGSEERGFCLCVLNMQCYSLLRRG
ncbi:hypothetical protein V6Z88_010323 [Aspergillus fumigatus]